jgi:hypothetical protein
MLFWTEDFVVKLRRIEMRVAASFLHGSHAEAQSEELIPGTSNHFARKFRRQFRHRPGAHAGVHGETAVNKQCAPVLVKVRHRLTTSHLRRSKLVRNIDPRAFANEAEMARTLGSVLP